MAEYDKNRKKKFYATSKEITPRKPVILVKNDRENRDNDRDKREKSSQSEKEKPTVIMIKAREPSTTKEVENRPQSPKKITGKENETEQIVQPIKIAQNENKEKKAAESKCLSTPLPMSSPTKLIDDYMEFIPTVSEFLQDTNTNFLVVGVIGGQSVGKSTIMNILAHSNDLSSISEEILKSHEMNLPNSKTDNSMHDGKYDDNNILQPIDDNIRTFTNSKIANELKPSPLVFKCQDMEHIETGQACTLGVDVYVTDSRVILLDSGAIGGAGNTRTISGLGSNMMGKGGLEVSAFLLAVCHVIILVQDWFVDVNMLRFIQSAEMVKPSIPASSNQNPTHQSSQGTGTSSQESDSPKDHFPHLLFLQNKCTMNDFNPQSIKTMQDLYRKAFSKSKMHIESGMFLYDSDNIDTSCQIDGTFHNLSVEKCGKPLNMFLIPAISDDQRFLENNNYNGHPTLEELAERLRWTIFGVSRNQLTNVQLTEKTWLQYCSKTWDNIKKSTFFLEYNRLLP